MLSFMLRSPEYDLARNVSLFTRLFLTERHMRVRHETNAWYDFVSYVSL